MIVQFVPFASLNEPSLGLMRFARTCFLHQSYGYDIFWASCPPPFQGQLRSALLFKFAPGEFVSVASTTAMEGGSAENAGAIFLPPKHTSPA